MRPTVTEQLAGVARILEDIVVPVVDDAYATDILVNAIATIDALATGWREVPAFLAWDARESVALLQGAGVRVPDDPDPLDLDALEAHHEEVRALLVEHLDVVPADELAAHFRARAERYPIKAAQRMPGQR